MRLPRFLLRDPALPLTCAGAAGGLAALASTWRWSFEGLEQIEAMEAREGAGGGIFAFWHSRILYGTLCPRWRGRGYTVVVSRSLDGEAITRIAHWFGHRIERGGSSAGGEEALRAMAALVREGRIVGFTPDGPSGPRHVARRGFVVLAQRTGAPIVPIAAAADRRWRVRSWDRFEIPAPLARIRVTAGPHLCVGPREDLEEARVRIERALLDTTARAEAAFGRPLE